MEKKSNVTKGQIEETSKGKNIEWRKRRMGQNLKWDKMPNGTKRRMGQKVE
jgi:hypothetical protein